MSSGLSVLRRALGLLLPFALGGLTFTAAQIPLLGPATSSGRENMGWFLNSGRNIVIITLPLLTVAAATTALGRGAPMAGALALCVGAMVAMVVILFRIGAGNLFPIVIIMGGAFLGIAAVAGMAIGVVLRRVFTREP